MSMSVGGVATMWLTARLLQWYHWRDIFRAYSLVGIAWAVVFFLVFRTRPEEHPGVNESERRLIRGGVQGVGEEGRGPALSWLAVLGSMSMWALCGQMIFRAAGYNFFVTFFPAFLEFAYGVPKEDAGMLTTWPLLGVVAGSLLGGTLVDRLYRWTQSKRASRCGVAVGTLLLTAGLTWASAYTDSAEGLAAVIAAGALASGMSMACPWTAVIDLGGRNAAVAMGVMNSAGCLAGILISPEVGRLMDTVKATGGDWNLVIYLHAAFYLASALFWVAVNPDRPIGHKGAGE
jgi:sugar phosphate permease